jgi:hypothetical protein
MKFKGTTKSEREECERKWNQIKSELIKKAPEVFEFASRLAEEIERLMPAGQRVQVRQVAERAFDTAGGRAMSPEQINQAIGILFECWEHGLSIRNWGLKKGHYQKP